MPNYPIRNPNIVLHNFPVVDKNVIFVHGIAAVQELIRQLEGLREEVASLREMDVEMESLASRVRTQFSEEECGQRVLNERIQLLESQLKDKGDQLVSVLVEERLDLANREAAEQRELLAFEQAMAAERWTQEEQTLRETAAATLAAERAAATRKEELRRQTEETLLQKRAELDSALEAERARLREEAIRAEVEVKAEQERLNEDLVVGRMRLKASLETERIVSTISAVTTQVGDMVRELSSRPEQVAYAVAAALALMLVYHLLREGITLLRSFIQAQLGRPSLVRETSVRWRPLPFYPLAKTVPERKADVESLFDGIVLSDSCKESIFNLALTTRNSRRLGVPFRHVLLHGPPGTGKTLVARRLAQSSGMDYAIMSGGDVGPLGEDAVTQLHSLFRWASRSAHGLIVFVDEAEAFLSKRGGVGSGDEIHRRHALNALLYQTGTQTKAFMLGIFAPSVFYLPF